MGTIAGQMKANAKRIGIPMEDWLKIKANGCKRCPKCKRTLPRHFFAEIASRPRQIFAYCRPCKRDYARKLYHRTKGN